MFKIRTNLQKSIHYILALILTTTLFFTAVPETVKAGGTDYCPQATAGLLVNVMVEESPVQVQNFSLNDLKSRTQHEERFSSIDSMPAPRGDRASGVYLSEVLQASGITDTSDVSKIKLYAVDGWYRSYTADYLWGSTRYYYPELNSTWDADNQQPGSGADTNPVIVEPLFALECYGDRYQSDSTLDSVAALMDSQYIVRFFFGQTATELNNGSTTSSSYGKWIYRMDVTLNDEVTPPAADPLPLSSPVLSASYTDHSIESGTVGQTDPIPVTFTDDPDWREAITEITVNGIPLTAGQFTASAGVISIDAGVFTIEGNNWIIVQATGYTDDCVVQIMELPESLATPNVALNGEIVSWGSISHAVSYRLTAVRAITQDVTTRTTTEAGYNLADLLLTDGVYSVTVTALAEYGSNDYRDSSPSDPVTYTIGTASPEWLPDSIDTSVGQSITFTYTPVDSIYQAAISGVSVNGNAVDTALYDATVDGELTLDSGLFPVEGNYIIIITAEGYIETMVTQTVFPQSPVLAHLYLSGTTVLVYEGEAFDYILSNLTLNGADQHGDAYDISGMTVTWLVHSGPATVLGNTLTITSSGNVSVSAAIGGITSNQLELAVITPTGVPNPGYPDEVILSWTDDTATTQTISWRTGTDTTQDQVQYLPESEYSGSFDGALSATGVRTCLYPDNYHFEATLTGLSPETTYTYRIGGGETWSDAYSFTTGGNIDTFSFLYMGDVQKGIETWTGLLQSVYIQNPDLRFALMGGDMVNIANSTNEWESLLTGASPVYSRIPVMTTAGNHEEPDIANLEAYPLYRSSYALPENGPEGYETEHFYSFDYANCHVSVLDSNIIGTVTPEDADYNLIRTWLENDLNSSDQTWKFLLFHHPAYPVVADACSTIIQQHWAPVFEACGVDMAFVGHQHVYMRSNLMYDGQSQSGSEKGTVYIMGNAGSKFYDEGTEDEFQYAIAAQIASTSNYELIHIDGNTLTLTAKDSQGNVLDTHTIVKPDGFYTIVPDENTDIWQNGTTAEGIVTMTVEDGVSGMKYFGVTVNSVTGHRGEETILFVQLRNGEQVDICVSRSNFDVALGAQAGFDVLPGDVIKVYITDGFDTAIDSNPDVLLLQSASSGSITALPVYSSTGTSNTITVSGSTDPDTWVGIKIVNTVTRDVVFYGAVKSDAIGEFSDAIQISDDYTGSLTVVTGSGFNVVTSVLNVGSCTVPGDANNDGQINVYDITMVARIILEIDSPVSNADANGDGRINIFDITKIVRIILGLD